jgi:catechol-2,3-dioxygenase
MSSTLSPVRLSHVAYRTNRLHAMSDWYTAVLGARVVFGNAKMAVLTYDDEHHRIALVAIEPYAESRAEPTAPASVGFYHVAFTYAGLDVLLAKYEWLKGIGIVPYRTINHGPTLSFYYRDPDRNDVELQVDAFADAPTTEAWMQGPEFAANPIGIVCDPEELIARRRSGASDADLLRRADR